MVGRQNRAVRLCDKGMHVGPIAVVHQPAGFLPFMQTRAVILLGIPDDVEHAGLPCRPQTAHGGEQLIHALFPHDAPDEKETL